jgi:hypothetical protein
LIALPAFAKPAEPPAFHQIRVSDADLSLIGYLIAHAGAQCSAANEQSCRAQIAADQLAKSIGEQIASEGKAKK